MENTPLRRALATTPSRKADVNISGKMVRISKRMARPKRFDPRDGAEGRGPDRPAGRAKVRAPGPDLGPEPPGSDPREAPRERRSSAQLQKSFGGIDDDPPGVPVHRTDGLHEGDENL